MKDNKNFDSLVKELKIDNLNYISIDKLQYNLADINVELLNKTDDKNITSLIAVIGVLEKIKECDDKSATKCFTCINEIKNLINESEDIKNE